MEAAVTLFRGTASFVWDRDSVVRILHRGDGQSRRGAAFREIHPRGGAGAEFQTSLG